MQSPEGLEDSPFNPSKALEGLKFQNKQTPKQTNRTHVNENMHAPLKRF